MKNRSELMIWASGFYLTEKLPDNLELLSKEELHTYIAEHTPDLFRMFFDSSTMLEFIIDLAIAVDQDFQQGANK